MNRAFSSVIIIPIECSSLNCSIVYESQIAEINIYFRENSSTVSSGNAIYEYRICQFDIFTSGPDTCTINCSIISYESQFIEFCYSIGRINSKSSTLICGVVNECNIIEVNIGGFFNKYSSTTHFVTASANTFSSVVCEGNINYSNTVWIYISTGWNPCR